MIDTNKTDRKFRFYILGTVLTLAAFFAIIELSTRTISWIRGDGFVLGLHELDATDARISEVYQFHPFTGFTFRPSHRFTGSHPAQQNRVQLTTDQYGFLADSNELSLAKEANEIRIATIGASTTANVNLSHEENWPGQLGRLLQESLPDNKITVINAGIPGFNTAQSIANLALRVMPFKPDLVIIYHAYNDLKVLRPGFDPKPDYSNVHKRAYGTHDRPNMVMRPLNHSMFYVRSRNSYRSYLKAVKTVDIVAQRNRLARVPDSAATIFEHNVRMLVAIAHGGGAKVVLSSFATLHDIELDYENVPAAELTQLKGEELVRILNFTPGLSLNGIFGGIKQYNEVLRNLADEVSTGWVDSAQLISKVDENFVDRVHFSALGAKRLAESFLPAVLVQFTPVTQTSDQAVSN